MTPLALAIERHRTAQAAIDAAVAADSPEDYPDHLNDAEIDARNELAETPCANDAEFIEKLRYLHAFVTRIFGPPTVDMNSVRSLSRSIVTSPR